MTTSRIIKSTAGGVLKGSISIAHVAKKYGLSFAKEAPEMIFGGAQNLAEQFAPEGIRTKTGKKMYDAGVNVTGDVMDFSTKAMKKLKENIH